MHWERFPAGSPMGGKHITLSGALHQRTMVAFQNEFGVSSDDNLGFSHVFPSSPKMRITVMENNLSGGLILSS